MSYKSVPVSHKWNGNGDSNRSDARMPAQKLLKTAMMVVLLEGPQAQKSRIRVTDRLYFHSRNLPWRHWQKPPGTSFKLQYRGKSAIRVGTTDQTS